ncbi:MAG: cytosine permease [Spirochaetaceae bacterium]|jgi:putative hydroxymethylpyrimidine transporter CytX|nr:cytosine permease [Spirochaetaceae bacterium]
MKKSTMLLLWAGAAISISEIVTGGLLAPLGFAKAALAIVLGHLAGTGLLALGGIVSFSRRKNAMETVAATFGPWGGKAVALCNVVQLIGWTIVMIVQGSRSVALLFPALPFPLLAGILALLVLAWALILGSPAQRLNDVVVLLLALLCAALFVEARLKMGGGQALAIPVTGGMGFLLALELSMAMPISWLPLVGDYACQADNKISAGAMPFAGYFVTSTLMYLFGLYINVNGGGDIFAFIAASSFRLIAGLVVILSTVTTAFLDLYSAAKSARVIVPVKNDRLSILIIGLFAVAASVAFPVERYEAFLETFLLAIGRVFLPVYGVVFAHYFYKKLTVLRDGNKNKECL